MTVTILQVLGISCQLGMHHRHNNIYGLRSERESRDRYKLREIAIVGGKHGRNYWIFLLGNAWKSNNTIIKQ